MYEFFTKLHPLTSQTYDLPSHLKRSKPQTYGNKSYQNIIGILGNTMINARRLSWKEDEKQANTTDAKYLKHNYRDSKTYYFPQRLDNMQHLIYSVANWNVTRLYKSAAVSVEEFTLKQNKTKIKGTINLGVHFIGYSK